MRQGSEAAVAVEMFLDDAQKSRILGISEKQEASPIENAFYFATLCEKQGKIQEAASIYNELLNANFGNPVLCSALGMNYSVAGQNGLGLLLLQQALAKVDRIIDAFKALGVTPKLANKKAQEDFIRTKRSEITNAIGACFKHENRVDEARQYFEKAQSLVPLNADIQNNLATLYINEGKPEQAIATLERALSVNPDHAQAHWNRSLAYLELGDYKRGWLEYDYGFSAKVRVEREYTKTALPTWQGEKNARVIVYGEQGIGDEILFASMLPDLIADCELVVFDCHKKLHTLFCNSFPNIDIYPTREDPVLTWPVKQDGTLRYDFTHKIAIGSLGRYYRPNLDAFPTSTYIQATTQSKVRWAAKLAELPKNRPNIGISWIGGHKRTRMEVRSLTLKQLEPLLRISGCNWISLQYTPAEAELAAFERETGIHIHHWSEAVYSANYDDTAGLVANLDLVISVATSVCHLSGSMGVPTWIFTASRSAWREFYGIGEDRSSNPWYASWTMFRQQSNSKDWNPVIEEVVQSLQLLLDDIATSP